MERCKRIKAFSLGGFVFSVILGTLLHFAFEASGGSTLVGAFTPVNESVWEHLKLILYPMLIFAIPEYFAYGRNIANFLSSRVISIFAGMLCTIFLYYSVTGIFGAGNIYIHIGIFVFSLALAYSISCRLMCDDRALLSENLGIFFICFLTAVIILFIYYTFNPPMVEIFRDPLSRDFGII